MKCNRWTKVEVNFLKENFEIKGGLYCAEKLEGRTIEAVRVKAARLGLRRDGAARYDRPDTPSGYIYCFSCKEVLEEGRFYRKTKKGKYGKKSDMCRACSQESARRTYRKHSSSIVDKYKSHPEKKIYQNVKGRAKKQNIPFDLELSDIILPKKCPVLGIDIIPFSSSDNSPSVDKLDPNKGYVKGNIAIISRRANSIKFNANSDEILKVGNWLKDKGL